ncbi:MAG: carboxymuconolactone decarboxylase family protein [archaeon]|nr:carboxymuconolactone decarboxylase family protein [archaeon]MCP8305746.1 carboxymuconolactone decarboxylase family protein [archaeon]
MEEKPSELPPCLKILDEHDPRFKDLFQPLFEFTFAPGALGAKTKLLIAMAINARTGMGYGCSEIAKILEGMGTKKEEITEALRVAATVGAIQGIVSGSEAYRK